VQRRAFAYFGPTDTGKADKAARWYPLATSVKPKLGGDAPVLRDGPAAGAAAGNLLLPADAGPEALLFAGALAHGVVSLGWATVLAVAVRRTSLSSWAAPAITRAVAVGVAAGAAIAAVDLGLLARGPAGRRWPLIRALPVGPQVADHLAFGAVAGAVLRRRG